MEGDNAVTSRCDGERPQLVAIEENDLIDGLLLILNTVGGDVEAGLAIAEMIASMSKPSVSLVLGGGHSIGVPLAVSTDYSYIAPSATMTIHPIRLNGMIIGDRYVISRLISTSPRSYLNPRLVPGSILNNLL